MKRLVILGVALALLTGCSSGSGEKKLEKITVGASITPHAEILKQAVAPLKEKGYELVIKEYTDYVQPNLAVESGDLDANYFQHLPYLESFNEEKKTSIVSVAAIHYEPFGIYSKSIQKLDDLKDGDTVAVPNDTTNEARALQLLAAQKIITLKDGAGLKATIQDITSNPKNLKFSEIEAAQLPKSISDVTIAVINGNYALEANLSAAKDALAVEDGTSLGPTTYANIIAVKKGNENEAKIKALIEVLKSQAIKDYITKTYNGNVVAVD